VTGVRTCALPIFAGGSAWGDPENFRSVDAVAVERLGGRQVAFQGVEEFAGLLGLFTAGHNSVDQLTPTGEVLGCWCGLWCRLASHCPEVIAEMGEAVNPVVLDVPPVGGGVVATVER